MRVATNLRAIRAAADLSLREVTDVVGIAPGTLSMLERGRQLPADDQVAALELVYGPSETWWPDNVRALLQFDREDGAT